MIPPRPQRIMAPPAVHGGPSGAEDERLPVRLDFSTSVSAWGPADAVRRAVREASLDSYPDPESRAARRALAEHCGLAPEEITLGAGAAELIHAVCFAFLAPGDTALIPGPTFGEYARSVSLCGGRILHGMASEPDVRIDVEALASGVQEHRPRLVFFCAPNNPTGQGFARRDLGRIADACLAVGALLVLDQAYDAFLAEPLGTPALPGHPAVLHLRSITKDHALAGVRAGYAAGPARLVDALDRARVPWSVSTAAQAATVAALSPAAAAHLDASLPRLRSECARLRQRFERLGARTVPTDTHFFLADVGGAAALRERLLRGHGIKVRDCASFGLPRHVRVAARTPDENDELLRAMEAACST